MGAIGDSWGTARRRDIFSILSNSGALILEIIKVQVPVTILMKQTKAAAVTSKVVYLRLRTREHELITGLCQ